MTATLATPLAEPVNDWSRLAARARTRRRITNLLLYGFLAVGALPILVPYLWLFTVAMMVLALPRMLATAWVKIGRASCRERVSKQV